MLSNAYFLAKFRVDTAENEPAKNLQNFAKICHFLNGLFQKRLQATLDALVALGGVNLAPSPAASRQRLEASCRALEAPPPG